MKELFVKGHPQLAMRQYLLVLLIVGSLVCVQTAFGDDGLVQSSGLSYLGAFRVPQTGSPGFGYGGFGIAYNPANNSVFLGGNYNNSIAEISIPALQSGSSGGAYDPTLLNTATYLQSCVDPTNGNLTKLGSGGAACTANPSTLGGFMVYNGKLVGTSFIAYDGSGCSQLSHFTNNVNLSTNGFAGMYSVNNGYGAGFVDAYMSPIPAAYQSQLGGTALTGNCNLSIITRTSYGPTASVFDPSKLGSTSQAATMVVGYPTNHSTLGTWSNNSGQNNYVSIGDGLQNGFSGMGVVFPVSTRSVLFLGVHGLGQNCYGTGGASGGDCQDPDSSYKGCHAYPYCNYVWAYDVGDSAGNNTSGNTVKSSGSTPGKNNLTAVKLGQINPWDMVPYAVWCLPKHFGWKSGDIMGATLDPSTNKIYVSMGYSDNGATPVIEVYQVNAAVPAIPQMTQPFLVK